MAVILDEGYNTRARDEEGDWARGVMYRVSTLVFVALALPAAADAPSAPGGRDTLRIRESSTRLSTRYRSSRSRSHTAVVARAALRCVCRRSSLNWSVGRAERRDCSTSEAGSLGIEDREARC
jgi:hypothetical protein